MAKNKDGLDVKYGTEQIANTVSGDSNVFGTAYRVSIKAPADKVGFKLPIKKGAYIARAITLPSLTTATGSGTVVVNLKKKTDGVIISALTSALNAAAFNAGDLASGAGIGTFASEAAYIEADVSGDITGVDSVIVIEIVDGI